jgi:hypothetical protein
VTPRAEVLGNRTIRGEEPLRMPGGLEPLHTPLLLARGLMRIFRTVIEVATLPMFHPRQELPLGGTVAFQLDLMITRGT